MSAGFDVSSRFRCARCYCGQGRDHLLAMVVHHIAGDGASLAPLARDLVTAYVARAQGGEPGWAPLEVQYADYAVWQRTVVGDDADESSLAAKQLSYWRERLAGPSARLATDRPRPAVPSLRGATSAFTLLGGGARGSDAHCGRTQLLAVHGRARGAGRGPGPARAVPRTRSYRRSARRSRGAGNARSTIWSACSSTRSPCGPPSRRRTRSARSSTRPARRDLSAFANSDIPFERVAEVAAGGRAPAAQSAVPGRAVVPEHRRAAPGTARSDHRRGRHRRAWPPSSTSR